MLIPEKKNEGSNSIKILTNKESKKNFHLALKLAGWLMEALNSYSNLLYLVVIVHLG